jgi:hypothetical protein
MVGSDANLVSPTITNSSNLLVLFLLLEQFQPFTSGFSLSVDSSWESGKVGFSLLVSPIYQRRSPNGGRGKELTRRYLKTCLQLRIRP